MWAQARAKVIAKNIAGSGTAESAPTAEVGGVAPENILAPTVVGPRSRVRR